MKKTDEGKTDKGKVGRRQFLQTAGTAGLAGLAAPNAVSGAESANAPAGEAQRSPMPPPALSDAAETIIPPAPVARLAVERSGADFMVDVFRSLGFEYICVNPANTFRGLHESLLNHGGNTSPELITTLHEEASVAMGHGYFKVDGKPMLTCMHGTVGLMHASMAIYNAFSDRVPVYVTLGAPYNRDASFLSASTPTLMVRDYTKWDDGPHTLADFAESAVRAYKIAMTPPCGPVVLGLDQGLQEDGIPDDVNVSIPKLTLPRPPVPDSGSITELARMLVAADMPVIVADRLRTAGSMEPLVELAEALQAPVVSQTGLRNNFPSRHPLHGGGSALEEADLLLGLETINFSGQVRRMRRSSREVQIVTITTEDLVSDANYHNTGRYAPVDMALAADAEATLPALVEAVKRLITPQRQSVFDARGTRFASEKAAALETARREATYGWDASPISTARLSAELWDQLRHEDWALVGWNRMQGQFSNFWNFDKPYRSNGWIGGGGLGNGMPSAVGAALAHKKHGRLPVNLQNDGDFLFCPTPLWTAAKYQIPLLTVMRNNRAYHQELMQVQRICSRMDRGIDSANIGNEITKPNIDFAKLAESMGVYGEGPIENPRDLGPAIKRAVAVVKSGEPALIDVISQPR